jgi:hypothetical protein
MIFLPCKLKFQIKFKPNSTESKTYQQNKIMDNKKLKKLIVDGLENRITKRK